MHEVSKPEITSDTGRPFLRGPVHLQQQWSSQRTLACTASLESLAFGGMG